MNVLHAVLGCLQQLLSKGLCFVPYSKAGVSVTGPFVIVTELIYQNNSYIWGCTRNMNSMNNILLLKHIEMLQ